MNEIPRRWAEATWPDLRDRDAGRVVALLPVGATEAHGPHLPLATDVIIAEAMCDAAAPGLAAAGHEPWILPPLAYTAAPFAAAFPGTVSIRPETLTALVEDLGRALAAHGVGTLALANAHLDPAHIASLRAAVSTLEQDHAEGAPLRPVFPDVTRRALAARLTEEFQSGACHAGRYEGSVVMAARPELVRDGIARDLPPNPASLVTAIRDGKATFQEAGGAEAYFGDPASASAEEGRSTAAILGSFLVEAVVGQAPQTGPADSGTVAP